MTSANATVDELVSDPESPTWPERLKMLEHSVAHQRLMKSLATYGDMINSLGVFRGIAAQIPGLLRLDLGVILVGGWKKMADLRGYTDRAKYPADQTVFVEVTRHTVSSIHKPSLDIVVNGVKVDAVPFELKLMIVVDGAVLTIRDGRILSVKTGACKAGIEFKCEGYMILKRDSASVKAPGEWTFKEPVEIERGAPARSG